MNIWRKIIPCACSFLALVAAESQGYSPEQRATQLAQATQLAMAKNDGAFNGLAQQLRGFTQHTTANEPPIPSANAAT